MGPPVGGVRTTCCRLPKRFHDRIPTQSCHIDTKQKPMSIADSINMMNVPLFPLPEWTCYLHVVRPSQWFSVSWSFRHMHMPGPSRRNYKEWAHRDNSLFQFSVV